MALETGTYISDLVITNPTGADQKSTVDDHVRLVKSTIKSTFPNISGAVTPTHTELNFVDGVTSAIQTQLDAKQTASAILDEYAAVNPTAAGLALLDDADAAAQRATLGLATASQAEMEAGTEAGLRAMSPELVAQAIAALSVSRVKACVNFAGSDGSINGTPFNVSGVVKNATGDYTITFASAMADAHYCCIANADRGSVTGDAIVMPVTQTTTTVRVGVTTGSGSALNATKISVVIIA